MPRLLLRDRRSRPTGPRLFHATGHPNRVRDLRPTITMDLPRLPPTTQLQRPDGHLSHFMDRHRHCRPDCILRGAEEIIQTERDSNSCRTVGA